jgi:NADH-quinone oxidoreductase subunit G
MAESSPQPAKPAAPQPPPAAPAAAAAPQFPPAPAGKVNVLINGKHAVVDAKDNLIEAARCVGVEIPYFCYHPRLSIAGQCRMCLVDASDSPGKLVPGCQAKVKEGLQIKTNTQQVLDAQRASMEFHLVNHPVDCPICDQSGECKLQDYYMGYDVKPARIQTYKLNKPKRKQFGPLVVYDGERCILCTRCVRFMNEIAQQPQLAMVGRGDHSEIDTVEGQPLDSAYSGNTVDICPVGALLNRDFRFTSRVWYLDAGRTVCAGCANGCNVSADHRGGVLYRLLPKRNEEVNQVWLCDEGRATYHRAHESRVQAPRVGAGDEGEWPTPEAALDAVRDALKPLIGQSGLAVAISATCTNEEAFAAATFAKEVLKLSKIYVTGRPAGKGDDFLIREDKNPNRHGVALAATAAGLDTATPEALLSAIDRGEVKQTVLFGAEVPDEGKVLPALKKLQGLIVFAVSTSPVTDAASLLLPLSTHFESDGSFVNYYGRLQPFRRVIDPQHDSLPAWAWVAKLSAALGSPWAFNSGAETFALLAARSAVLKGLALETLPEIGVVLPGLAPTQYPRRAPRPATNPEPQRATGT